MKTQWLLRECFSVILERALHLKQLSQLVSTIPVSVGIFCIISISVFTFTLALKSAGLYNYEKKKKKNNMMMKIRISHMSYFSCGETKVRNDP